MALLVSLSFFMSPTHAKGPGSISITSSYDEKPRTPINLAVLVQGIDRLAGGMIEIEFDESIVQLKNISDGDLLQSAQFLQYNNLAAADRPKGTVTISFAAEKGIKADGMLLDLSFQLLRLNGETPIKIKEIALYDEQDNKVYVNVQNGSIQPFKGKESKKDKPVVSDKDWKIAFNVPVQASSINKHTVFILNNRTKEHMPVKLVLNGKELIVQAPSGGYLPGDYTLYVSDQAKSPGGRPLKEPVKMVFSVD